MTPAICMGIDGCPAGWVAATRLGVTVAATLDELLCGVEPAVVAIDMPIGLPERGRRACELAARRLLQPRRHHSVFWIPTRAATSAQSQADASAINRRHGAGGVSAQSYHLFPRIRELDRLLTEHPGWRGRIHETHPELSFAAMASAGDDLTPLAYPKKSGLGAHQRLNLLFTRFNGAHFKAARALHSYRAVADDDIADAYACLFSAERIAAGRHVRLPSELIRDAQGRPMQICF